MLHLGTAFVLLNYFRKDWLNLILSVFQKGNQNIRKKQNRRVIELMIVATIPAVIIGKLFEHTFQKLFPSALSAAIFLLINGIILLIADRLRKHSGARDIEEISFVESFLIGVAQALALIPCISRSGITMTAGLGLGLSYEESARFSFLLATPIIFGAGILEVPKMMKSHVPHMLQYGIVGGIIAGVIAYISIAFLMRYFHNHEIRVLKPFAYYCIGIGALVAILAASKTYF